MQRYISALLLLYSLALCQTQPSPRQIEVTGTVVDAVTGQPIPRAQVTTNYVMRGDRTTNEPSLRMSDFSEFARGSFQSTLTDTSGKFSLVLKVTTQWALSISRNGYQQASHSEGLKPASANDDNHRNITIQMTPFGVIHGRLVNEAGEALPGIAVEVQQATVIDGFRNYQTKDSRRTDDRGEYRAWDLPPGDYYVKATGQGGRLSSFMGTLPLPNADETHGTQFYPGAKDREQAEVLHVPPGATVRADFTMETQPAYRIRGKLLNCASPDSVQIRLLRGTVPVGSRVRIDAAKGEFELWDVPSGTYQLDASEYSATGEKSGVETVIVRDGDVTGVMLTIQDGATVTSTVRYLGGAPDSRSYGPVLQFYSTSNTTSSRSGRRKYVSASDENTLSTTNMLPGHYVLDVRPVPGYYLRSATSGTVDLLSEGLTVSAGAVPAPLEIVLQRGGGTIEGTVADLPKNGGRILVVRRGAPAAPQTPSYAGNNGTFRISNLAPDDYSVYAWPATAELEYRNPAVLDRLSKYATKATLREGETQTITVRAIPKEEL